MSTIANHMTPQPWSVQIDDSIGVARQMLAEREVHHLPVLDADKLVGIVDSEDIARAANRVAATVEDVMSSAHAVDVDTPLDEVLATMTVHGWHAVVVTKNQRVAGIFTAMDAVRVLHDLLRAA